MGGGVGGGGGWWGLGWGGWDEGMVGFFFDFFEVSNWLFFDTWVLEVRGKDGVIKFAGALT